MGGRTGRIEAVVAVLFLGFVWMGCGEEFRVTLRCLSDCNDNNECTVDVCDEESVTCLNTPVDNDTPCTGGTCQSGMCMPDTPGTCEEIDVLVNGDFEEGDDSSTELLPTSFGQWVGDQRMIVSTADDGITPVGENGLMLQFLATTPVGPSAMSNAAEVRQAVDLSACKETRIQVEGKAQFNRIVGDSETAKTFTLFLWAFDGPLSELPNKYKQVPAQELAKADLQVMVDAVGWEEVSVPMVVPAEADYVLLELIVNEAVPRDNMEFDGQIADAASLTISFVP